MTTPSKMKRLNQAANLYMDFALTAMKLCETIVKMDGVIAFPEDVDPEVRAFGEALAKAQQAAFKEKLMPMIHHLEVIDQRMKDNIVGSDSPIILASDDN